MNCNESNGFLPDFDAVTPEQWQACELLYICTPGNPAGAVMPRGMLQKLIQLADEHDFLIASDECYSEIYPDEAHHRPGYYRPPLSWEGRLPTVSLLSQPFEAL